MSKSTGYRALKAIFDRFTQLNKRMVDGKMESFNELEFQQKSNCGQLIWAMNSQLNYMEGTSLPKAVDELRALHRTYDGSEIPANQLNKKVSWIARIETQCAEQSAWIGELKEAYEELFGEKYSAGTKKSVANKDEVAAQADEILKRYGKQTEVDTSYNSNTTASHD